MNSNTRNKLTALLEQMETLAENGHGVAYI